MSDVRARLAVPLIGLVAITATGCGDALTRPRRAAGRREGRAGGGARGRSRRVCRVAGRLINAIRARVAGTRSQNYTEGSPVKAGDLCPRWILAVPSCRRSTDAKLNSRESQLS